GGTGGELRIRANGSQHRRFFHLEARTGCDNLDAHKRILIEQAAVVGLVGAYASNRCRGMYDNLGPICRKRLFDFAWTCTIVVVSPGVQKAGASGRLQQVHDMRTEKAGSSSEQDSFGAEIESHSGVLTAAVVEAAELPCLRGKSASRYLRIMV